MSPPRLRPFGFYEVFRSEKMVQIQTDHRFSRRQSRLLKHTRKVPIPLKSDLELIRNDRNTRLDTKIKVNSRLLAHYSCIERHLARMGFAFSYFESPSTETMRLSRAGIRFVNGCL